MLQIQFYHLLNSTAIRALPPLLQKAFKANYRTHILLDTKDALKELDDWLWAYDADSFLPHGAAGKEHHKQQPICLSTELILENNANLLVITNGHLYESAQNTKTITRIVDLFNGNDETSVIKARERWKHYKQSESTELTYWQQQHQGGWKKAA